MAKEYRVLVTNKKGAVIGRVRYNTVLDYWNGKEWGNGGFAKHLGLTKLKDGQYVIICGTDLQGEKDTAYIVSAEDALKAIQKSQHLELLDTKKFKDLKKLSAVSSIKDLEEE
jgi:hypothetical protein